MVLKIPTFIVLVTMCMLAVTATASDDQPAVTVDLGWLEVNQTNNEWRVVRTSEPLPSPGALRVNDILTAVDDLRVNDLNALSAARVLSRITLNAKTISVIRAGVITKLNIHESSEPLAALLMTEPNTNPVVLYSKDERAPNLSLPDSSGQMVTIKFREKWTLIHIWNTLCDRFEIEALNEMAMPNPDMLNVVGVAMNDTAGTLKQFSTREPIEFVNLLGGDYDGKFAGEFNYFALRTDILVDPEGRVVFVGSGPSALSRAWKIFREHASRKSLATSNKR